MRTPLRVKSGGLLRASSWLINLGQPPFAGLPALPPLRPLHLLGCQLPAVWGELLTSCLLIYALACSELGWFCANCDARTVQHEMPLTHPDGSGGDGGSAGSPQQHSHSCYELGPGGAVACARCLCCSFLPACCFEVGAEVSETYVFPSWHAPSWKLQGRCQVAAAGLVVSCSSWSGECDGSTGWPA